MARRSHRSSEQRRQEAEPALPSIEQLLGHTFARPGLLILALTHRSFVFDGLQAAVHHADPSEDNEQLEFLGDAVLGMLAAEALCRRFPALREGELTRLRAAVVSRRYLGEVGTRLGLGRFLRLGHTAEKNQARTSAAVFSNTVEALIAALYLDGGLDPARRFVEAEILPGAPLAEAAPQQAGQFSRTVGDHKSALQEILQAQARPRPSYHLLAESGPAHRPIFHVEVRLEGETLAHAEATTKKAAEQEAARLAVARLSPGGFVLHA